VLPPYVFWIHPWGYALSVRVTFFPGPILFDPLFPSGPLLGFSHFPGFFSPQQKVGVAVSISSPVVFKVLFVVGILFFLVLVLSLPSVLILRSLGIYSFGFPLGGHILGVGLYY